MQTIKKTADKDEASGTDLALYSVPKSREVRRKIAFSQQLKGAVVLAGLKRADNVLTTENVEEIDRGQVPTATRRLVRR